MTRELTSRQSDPDCQRLLKASLHCDRQSRRWDFGGIACVVLAALLPALQVSENHRAVVQVALSALVAALFARRSHWVKSGQMLRNAFEYSAFTIAMPYPIYVEPSKIDQWHSSYIAKPTNKTTSDWFKVTEQVPAEQVREAQLSSLKRGAVNRVIWGTIVAVFALTLGGLWLYLSANLSLDNTASAVSFAALIATIAVMGKTSHQALSYSKSRMVLAREIRNYPHDYSVVSAVFQERLNGLRSSRIVVPSALNKIVDFAERYWQVKQPIASRG